MTNRTALVPKVLAGNTAIVNMLNDGTNMTAFDNTNGMSVAITTTGLPAGGDIDRLILLVLNTNGTGRTITIRGATKDGGLTKTGAGTGDSSFPPGFQGSKGDFTTAALTATTGLGVIGPFEVARFIQPDNTLSIDASGAVGFIAAILLPRAF